MDPAREDVSVDTEDGWRLRGFWHRGRGRAAVVCGHAMMANAASFERGGIPGRLAAAGFEVYVFDLRGHGRSRRGPADSWSYDDIALRDLPAIVGAVRARHPGLPLAVIGHSLVGHACLGWLGQQSDTRVDAVVAVAANVWLRRLEVSWRRWLQKRLLIEAMSGWARLAGRFPARRLRLGTEDVAAPYARQFVTWARRNAWTTVDGRDYLAGLARVRTPVLVVLGEADRILCHPESGAAFASHLSGAPVTVWTVRRGEIDGLVPDHMRLVTDPAAAPLWERIARWLDRTLPTAS